MTAPSTSRARSVALVALVFGVASPLKAGADEPPLPPPRPPELAAPETPAEAPAPPAPAAPTGDAASTCLAKLIASGASAEASPPPATSIEGCGIDAPVRLSSILVGGDGVQPARPPAHRLQLRVGAGRLRPPDRRAAWRGHAARRIRGNRNRSRLHLPDAGPHRRGQDQRPRKGVGGRLRGDHARGQAAGV